MNNLKVKIAAFVSLCAANVGMAVAGTDPGLPPVEVSAPSIISLAAVAVVAGFVAYKRRK